MRCLQRLLAAGARVDDADRLGARCLSYAQQVSRCELRKAVVAVVRGAGACADLSDLVAAVAANRLEFVRDTLRGMAAACADDGERQRLRERVHALRDAAGNNLVMVAVAAEPYGGKRHQLIGLLMGEWGFPRDWRHAAHGATYLHRAAMEKSGAGTVFELLRWGALNEAHAYAQQRTPLRCAFMTQWNPVCRSFLLLLFAGANPARMCLLPEAKESLPMWLGREPSLENVNAHPHWLPSHEKPLEEVAEAIAEAETRLLHRWWAIGQRAAVPTLAEACVRALWRNMPARFEETQSLPDHLRGLYFGADAPLAL